jgi:nitrate/nitrite transporter NarK
MLGFSLSVIGGVMLCWLDQKSEDLAYIIIGVAFARFGASISQCTCYISTPFIFPLMMCGTAFAICNLFGRIGQSGSSFLTELDNPTPMIIFSSLALFACLVSLIVRPIKD